MIVLNEGSENQMKPYHWQAWRIMRCITHPMLGLVLGGALGWSGSMAAEAQQHPASCHLEQQDKQQGKKKISIIATGNLRGGLSNRWAFPTKTFPKQRSHGLAYLSPIILNARQQDPQVIVLDSGDALHGARTGHQLKSNPASRHAIPIITWMNALGYDAMAMGNYDMMMPIEQLQQAQQQSQFAWLAANLPSPITGVDHQPYVLLQRHGIRIAVLGFARPDSRIQPSRIQRSHIKSSRHKHNPTKQEAGAFVSTNISAVAKRWIHWLRHTKQADLVIGLMHTDWSSARSEVAAARQRLLRPNVLDQLAWPSKANRSRSFDLIIHSSTRPNARRQQVSTAQHSTFSAPIPTIATGSNGKSLALIAVEMSCSKPQDHDKTLYPTKGIKRVVKPFRWHLTRMKATSIKAHQSIESLPPLLAAHFKQVGNAHATQLQMQAPLRIRRKPGQKVFARCAGDITTMAARHIIFSARTKNNVRLPANIPMLLPFRWFYYPPQPGEIVQRAHIERWLPYAETLVLTKANTRQLKVLLGPYVRWLQGWRAPAALQLLPIGMRVELTEPQPFANVPKKRSDIRVLKRAAFNQPGYPPNTPTWLPMQPNQVLPFWTTRYLWQGGGGLASQALWQQSAFSAEIKTALRDGIWTVLRDPHTPLSKSCRRWMEPIVLTPTK